MRIIFGLLIVLLTATPALSSCPSGLEQTTEHVGVSIGGSWGRIFFSDLTTSSKKQQEAEIEEIIQKWLTFTIPLSSLPLDDPDRFINPDQNRQFWSDADGNRVDEAIDATHYTSVACTVEANWSDEEQAFVMTYRVIPSG
jgi:hypothetical protein